MEARKLHDATKTVESCRHHVQHIRRHLSEIDKMDFPILGSISSVSNDRNYTLLPSQPTEGYGAPSIAFDSKQMKHVCRYQFMIGPHRIAIDAAYDGIKEFWQCLEKVSHITPAEVKSYEWGILGIFKSELELHGGA